MEKALQNTIIAKTYSLTLKSFFKNQFKYGNDCYIRASCSFVCKKQEKCDGHQFLDFVELIYYYQRYCVKYKKVCFNYFYFYSFKLTSDTKMTLKPIKIKGWRMIPADMETISHLTYSQSLSIFKF